MIKLNIQKFTETIFNETSIENIYFNKNELDKVYFNDVLVFEKQQLYKRRIMVGDNLRGITMYQDFPQNYNENEKFVGATGWTSTDIVVIDDSTNIAESYYGSDEGVYVQTYNMSDGSGLDDSFYYFDIVGCDPAHVGNVTCKNDKDYIVTSIIDNNSSYRHIYIEDPNIRPLQTGDKIVKGTKLYFVFPDDCYKKIRSSEYIVKINTIANEELGIITYGSASSQEINIGKITYDPNKVVNNGTTIYVWVDMLGQLYKNTSFNLVEDLSLDGLQFIGAVSEINSNSEIYNYILVDTTTLGT